MLWKVLHTRKTKFYISAIMWNDRCTKYIVPDSERYPEIDSVGFVFWDFIRMVPDMHLRTVEYFFHKRPQYKNSNQCDANQKQSFYNKTLTNQNRNISYPGYYCQANQKTDDSAADSATYRNIAVVVVTDC